jgi:hypothetical protein
VPTPVFFSPFKLDLRIPGAQVAAFPKSAIASHTARVVVLISVFSSSFRISLIYIMVMEPVFWILAF